MVQEPQKSKVVVGSDQVLQDGLKHLKKKKMKNNEYFICIESRLGQTYFEFFLS
jgi:hypothetical protein